MKLFKFILISILLFGFSVYSLLLAFNTWEDPNEKLYTNNESNAVLMNGNSLEGGINKSTSGINGIVNPSSGDHIQSTIDYISKWVSYFLGILAVLVLFLLVYNGIMMITAGGEEERYSNGMKNLKNYTIGLIFIGLAWLFVMLIFYVIRGFYYTGV